MKKRVALITGTSSGFGMLTVVEMVRSGFLVIATMRNLEKRHHLEDALSKLKLSTIKEELSSKLLMHNEKYNEQLQQSSFFKTPHPLCKFFKLDVTDSDSINHCVYKIIEHFGVVDVLINNAGSGLGGFAEDISIEEFRAQFETNFWGLVGLTKAIIPYMRNRRQGHVINISSIAGLMGIPGLSSYCASKFAVEGFSESLRYELLPFNVWVSLVEPGTYRTNIHANSKQLVTSAFCPDSAYYEWGKQLLSITLEQVKSAKADPQEVAKLITNIAETERPKARYLIGREASYPILKYIIPGFLFERLMCWFSGYTRKKTEKLCINSSTKQTACDIAKNNY